LTPATSEPHSKLRTRLAPTPSGLLHPGNGLNFIMTYAIARAQEGHILLRIDDLDKARCREEYVEDIFHTLDWLGLDYDEGPSGVEDFFQNWSQHTRLEEYANELDNLREANHLFACTCSRRQIREVAPGGGYPNTCRQLSLNFDGPRTAWRVNAPPEGRSISLHRWKEAVLEEPLDNLDAFVVRQKNRLPAYQLASLVDDTRYAINFIVRGADLWESTLAQSYLAQLLGKDTFLQTTFWHHALITDANGQKLSKTKGAGSLKAWRESGKPPEELFRLAALQLGIGEDCHTLEDLLIFMET